MWLSLTVRPFGRGGGYTVELINSLIGDEINCLDLHVRRSPRRECTQMFEDS